MRQRYLKEIKEDLQRRRKGLLSEAGEAISDNLNHQVTNLPDPSDLASSESDQSFSIRLRERERRLLKKIEEALERIENGTYGVCEVCGGQINEKRLKARPVTTMCIKCKIEEEEKEKRQIE